MERGSQACDLFYSIFNFTTQLVNWNRTILLLHFVLNPWSIKKWTFGACGGRGGASAPVAPPLPTGLTVWIKTLIINRTRGDSHQGGKRRGLGPRNDVLTTCKAVNQLINQRCGQRIIAVFFPQ